MELLIYCIFAILVCTLANNDFPQVCDGQTVLIVYMYILLMIKSLFQLVKVVTLFAFAERDSAQMFSLYTLYLLGKLGRRVTRQ